MSVLVFLELKMMFDMRVSFNFIQISFLFTTMYPPSEICFVFLHICLYGVSIWSISMYFIIFFPD
jgi:hypothetical protein